MAKQNKIVAQFEDAHGNKVALFAHRNFQWSVYSDIDGFVATLQGDRVITRREYNRLHKIYGPRKRRRK